MLMWEKRLAKLLNKEEKKSYVYYIEYNKQPIYVGSTKNIKSRQRQHNKYLMKEGVQHKNWNHPLYCFLRENGVVSVELKVIKIVEDVKEGFNYKREVIEEKAIDFCLNKGIKLFNSIYPCKYNEEGLFIIRKIYI